MTDRQRPPDRRPSVNRRLTWQTEAGAHQFHVTVGFDPRTCQPVEVFYADGQKAGSDLKHAIQDACILISMLLQHGVAPSAITKSLSTAPIHGETRPATVIGVIAADLAQEVIA